MTCTYIVIPTTYFSCTQELYIMCSRIAQHIPRLSTILCLFTISLRCIVAYTKYELATTQCCILGISWLYIDYILVVPNVSMTCTYIVIPTTYFNCTQGLYIMCSRIAQHVPRLSTILCLLTISLRCIVAYTKYELATTRYLCKSYQLVTILFKGYKCNTFVIHK